MESIRYSLTSLYFEAWISGHYLYNFSKYNSLNVKSNFTWFSITKIQFQNQPMNTNLSLLGEGDSGEKRLWPIPTGRGEVTMVSEVSC